MDIIIQLISTSEYVLAKVNGLHDIITDLFGIILEPEFNYTKIFREFIVFTR
ncbi:MAG: hypothetical protein PVF58_22065 [Candidatus Methanofastidiosia archaeon]